MTYFFFIIKAQLKMAQALVKPSVLAKYWDNPSKRGRTDGIFQGLAGLLRGISRSSPASQRKTSQDINVLK